MQTLLSCFLKVAVNQKPLLAKLANVELAYTTQPVQFNFTNLPAPSN